LASKGRSRKKKRVIRGLVVVVVAVAVVEVDG
jgi:hypothetical protein